MAILNSEQVQKADDLVRELIECPEWGGDIYVTTVTGDRLSKWENDISRRKFVGGRLKDTEGAKTSLLVLCCEDGNGDLIFSQDAVAWLGQKSAAVINRLWEAATRLNGIGEDMEKELEKNSAKVNPNGSGSSSPDKSEDALSVS